MILFLAYISIIFLLMQLANSLLNILFKQKLMHSASVHKSEPCSVLIPARNEEDTIAGILRDLIQNTDPELEILVYDDQSSDNTVHIIQEYIKLDHRIKQVPTRSLPKAWLGKNHACYQLAAAASKPYFLFIDADVRLKEGILPDAIAFMKTHKLALLSIFPRQILATKGEKLSVPLMNYILLTLLPLVFVQKSPFSSHSAANGQFMLFDAGVYSSVQPHQLFKTSAVEDIAIARHLKKQKLKLACLIGDARVECRMYNSYKQAFRGFTKNVMMFFGNMPLLAILFCLFSGFGFIPVLIATPAYSVYYFCCLAGVLILYSITSKQNILIGALFPFHLLFLSHLIVYRLSRKTQKGHIWKGRPIYS